LGGLGTRLDEGKRNREKKRAGVPNHVFIYRRHETAIYVLSGESGVWYGERLEMNLVARTGEFVYIPAGTPHLPYNLSTKENCVAVISRTDPNEQESVVLLAELDCIHP
jgi:uncharacterized RmlC-like cupin family protein